MSFTSRMTRSPRPFQPEIGRDVAGLFGDMERGFRELVEGTAGCSPYLAGLLRRERDWTLQLAESTPEALFADVLHVVEMAEPGAQKQVFRQAKARVALLTALADLGGVWSLEEVTGALTGLADACVHSGAKALVGVEIARGKLPGLNEDDAQTAGGMSLLAMGKMGAGELNYSSDIDLICLFDETRFDAGDYAEARAGFVKVTRRLMQLMSEVTAEGYVFRTDLRLRPDASVTPVCIAMETAERYYESVGRTWERAAFIKARACGGDLAAGSGFLQRLTPFVWRKHLDFAAIQDAHDMRLRIRDHKKLGGSFTLDGHNMKLGQGGIREIEFFTQTRQIIAGGRDANLRVRGTKDGLSKLVTAGWVEREAAERLSANYTRFREVEHRLQMIGDAQTHTLPNSDEGFTRLAAFMGEEVGAMRADLDARLRETSQATEAFFAPEITAHERSEVTEYLEKWRGLPALRSPRAVEIFERLFPEILERMQAAPRPEEALQAFERFLSGLPAGVQVFSMFEANPQLTQLFIDICTASGDLAGYLSRNAQVFDAVLAGSFFDPWPGVTTLKIELSTALEAAPDYEAQLDLARRWQKEWHFRTGVHLLRGLISPIEAGREYAQLAEAVLAALYPKVVAQFAAKHGDPPGRGACVLAMGSLGAGQLTARSDLDLIVIYDADGTDVSDGARPLTTRVYYARLTQALITAFTAPTAEGKLYEVDMRLRPSGQSGPVATSIQAYEAYQKNEAWFWEHMALTRARSVAGETSVGADVERIRETIIALPREPSQSAQETQDMRARLSDAGRHGSVWQVKDGAGGAQDIDLLAQGLALLAGSSSRNVDEQLRAASGVRLIDPAEAQELVHASDHFMRLTQIGRLLSDDKFEPETLGQGGQDMVLREFEAKSLTDLERQLAKCRKRAKTVIEQALSKLGAVLSATE
ncbi:MAG: DUF294 nucleotidyltransferase-like domain-containing protein [Pseudomonadota bacterium]